MGVSNTAAAIGMAFQEGLFAAAPAPATYTLPQHGALPIGR